MKTVFLFLTQFSHFSDVLRGKFFPYLSERYRVVVFTPSIDEGIAHKEGYLQTGNITYQKWKIQYPRFWVLFDKMLRVPFVREFDHLSYIQWFYKRPHSRGRKVLMKIGSWLPKKLMTAGFFTAICGISIITSMKNEY